MLNPVGKGVDQEALVPKADLNPLMPLYALHSAMGLIAVVVVILLLAILQRKGMARLQESRIGSVACHHQQAHLTPSSQLDPPSPALFLPHPHSALPTPPLTDLPALVGGGRADDMCRKAPAFPPAFWQHATQHAARKCFMVLFRNSQQRNEHSTASWP